ncbi:MAG: hypothetical protein KKB59_18385 [Spirochaetes bacterium]|nr:hypothetical protein [Spirochaetota bacterium]
MSKTLFVDIEPQRIKIDEDFWVDVPKEMSYGMAESFFGNENKMEAAKQMLVKAILKWNITEESGDVAEINEENIKRLPASVVTKILDCITAKLEVPKKKSSTSSEQSKEI